MLEIGIIIDLVHSPQGVKDLVYEINDHRAGGRRPLVFSHTGIREIAQEYNPHMRPEDLAYLPDLYDIQKIQECDGVLGIIFMDYWLNGSENTGNAIPLVIKSIKYIYDVCGNYNHVCLGSDFDGFTEVPADLMGPSYYPYLISAMRDANIAEADINKICFTNYLRVLENGWGPQHIPETT